MTSGTANRLLGLQPVFDVRARLLVLGSFPGVASLRHREYYAHPQNQFWPLLSSLLGSDLKRLPYTMRLAEVRAAGLAIWDVHQSCQRSGSLDTAIREPVANSLAALMAAMPALEAVAFNGATAARFGRRQLQQAGLANSLELFDLPSTSPAFAAMRFADKLAAWLVLRPYLLPVPCRNAGNAAEPGDAAGVRAVCAEALR